ncbi:hypothetical protein B0H17DRAFT_1137813 [Mycena rosella]|uniref:3'-5' exonuclease domain-containing protein n=1 Tax=Mycena rosella TaxID=1033263 RepID=A0AAD7D7S4_MYCRO|nr:hypothetical protein B0H17DRAFT_1137813 [Mycena rosella]
MVEEGTTVRQCRNNKRQQADTHPDTMTAGITAAATMIAESPQQRDAHPDIPSTVTVALTTTLPICGSQNTNSPSRKPYPMTDTIWYLTTESAVNDALAPIVDGVVGFDTEFDKWVSTKEEAIIEHIVKKVGSNKKSMLLAWQIIEQESFAQFPVAWKNIALCVVQIARGKDIWVMNLNKIKAYPKHLERILRSPDILKVRVGLNSDVPHLWADLRTDMRNMVDVGLMAKPIVLYPLLYGSAD